MSVLQEKRSEKKGDFAGQSSIGGNSRVRGDERHELERVLVLLFADILRLSRIDKICFLILGVQVSKTMSVL